MDKVVIYGDSWEDHREHIRAVLNRLRGAGLTAKPSNCQFAMAECVYLGIHAFRVYLLGKPFTVQTDHRCLEWLNQLKDTDSRLTG